MANKEREMREHFDELRKDICAENAKVMMEELARKELDTGKIQEENDALKMKNVEWIIQHSSLIGKMEKVQRDYEKLQSSHNELQQVHLHTNNYQLQLELDYNQMKRDYSELFISHKSLLATMHHSQDTVAVQELESKWYISIHPSLIHLSVNLSIYLFTLSVSIDLPFLLSPSH